MLSIRKQVQYIKNNFLNKEVNFLFKNVNVSGTLVFIGRSQLSLLTGSTYITCTINRTPYRIKEHELKICKFTLVKLHS
mgnify:CR=1 FL=1